MIAGKCPRCGVRIAYTVTMTNGGVGCVNCLGYPGKKAERLRPSVDTHKTPREFVYYDPDYIYEDGIRFHKSTGWLDRLILAL